MLVESYNYKPNYLVTQFGEANNSILPLMILKKILKGKKAISLPFSDYCEPLIYEMSHFKSLIDYLISYCENESIQSFEIRGGQEYFKDVQSAYSYYEHILELGAKQEDIFKRFNETTRRNIKKAIKEGIQTN